MLPTFPAMYQRRRAMNAQIIRELVNRKSPVLADIDSHFMHEGSGSEIHRHDQSVGVTDIKSHSAELEIPKMLLEDFDEVMLIKLLGDVAEQFAKSMSENLFQSVSEGAEAVGNVVDGAGRPFGPELLLEVLETLQMDFLPDGTWQAPTMVVSPEQYQKILEMQAQGTSKQHEQKLADIIEKKRNEFLSREASRVLAG
jgi:hypothetical protein